MARKPEVFVRELSLEEGQRLARTTRTFKNAVRLRRATIVMASTQGQSVPDIAVMFATTQGYVRQVVHVFNERGFAALDPVPGPEALERVLDFLRQLRRRYAGKLYVICDNFSPHKKNEVLIWCAEHDVELVFAPSNASWLNWIESEFAAVRYFTLDGSDYPDRATQEASVGGYLRWKNRHALPKTNFAIGSKVRRPDYLPIAA